MISRLCSLCDFRTRLSRSPPYRWHLEWLLGDADWDAHLVPFKNHPGLQSSTGDPTFSFKSFLTAPNFSTLLLFLSTPIRVCAVWHLWLARVASPFPRAVPSPTSEQSPALAQWVKAEGRAQHQGRFSQVSHASAFVFSSAKWEQ